jgi:hypothetical protein
VKKVWWWFWSAVVVSVATSLIASMLFEWKPPQFLEPINNFLYGLRLWLREDVTITRWCYWFLFGFFVVCVLLFAWSRIRRLSAPGYFRYRQDTVFGTPWRWNWSARGDITDLWCCCPICDRIMLYSTDYDKRDHMIKTTVRCEYHDQPFARAGEKDDLLNAVKREIDLKVRNGTWVQVVQSKR